MYNCSGMHSGALYYGGLDNNFCLDRFKFIFFVFGNRFGRGFFVVESFIVFREKIIRCFISDIKKTLLA